MATVPIFAPTGELKDVPYEQMNAAVQAGGKPAVMFESPQGEHKYVPADQVQDAVKAGGKILPFEQQENQHPTFISQYWDQLKGLAKSLPSMMGAMVGPTPVPMGGTQVGVSNPGGEQMSSIAENAARDQTRQAEGRSLPYRAAALVAPAAGVDVAGSEQAAREGDVNGVAARAAAPLTALVAAEAQAHLGPKAALGESVAEGPRAEFAAGRIAKLIKPMAGDLKYGAEPAAALPKEGITGNTLDDLGEKVYARARDVGQTIDAVAQAPGNAGKVVDVSQAVNGPIDDALKNAVRTGDQPLYDKLQALRKQVLNTWKEVEDAKGNKSLEPAAPRKLQMSPMDAIKLKRDIADMTRWTGDPMDNEVNAVKARMFGGIKDTVNQTVPQLKELNQRYADLVNAGKAIERRSPVAARSNDFSLGDLGTMLAGQALTGSSGAGIAAEVARRAAHSPGVVSRVANAVMPKNLKYEEPAAIRARLKAAEPEGGKPPQERRGGGETGPRAKVFSDEERSARAKAELERVARGGHSNPLVGNPFDRNPDFFNTIRNEGPQPPTRAVDVLSGKD